MADPGKPEPNKPSFFEKLAFWKKRSTAGPAVGTDVDQVFQEDEKKFPKVKPPTFGQAGVWMVVIAFLMAALAFLMYRLIGMDERSLYVTFAICAGILIFGLLLWVSKPQPGKTNWYVAMGKSMVVIYFIGISITAAMSLNPEWVTPYMMVRIFAFGMPLLLLGAWIVVVGPNPEFFSPVVFFGMGLIGGYGLAILFASLLFLADEQLLTFPDLLQVFLVGLVFWFGGVVALTIDTLRTPHPTRF